MTILLVDDSKSHHFLVTAILKGAGYTDVLQAESAYEAFKLLGMESGGEIPPVDLILMDISMPEMNGIQACERIKGVEALRDIPIIMVTASSEVENLQAAFAAGASDYIPKPLNKIELLARVRSALRLKGEMDRRKARERELLDVTHQLESAYETLQLEREKSERLLLNILPQAITERLKAQPDVIVDSFPEATVLFADLVGFSRMASQLEPARLVTVLNQLFSRFDELAERHGLEKIKTIGDAYLVVGGLPTPQPDHVRAVAEMALEARNTLAGLPHLDGQPLKLRLGIHTGPVIAGVIGTKKFSYDLWGETVNLARRMEEYSLPNQIQVTAAVQEQLAAAYRFEPRGPIEIKGIGTIQTYFLVGRQ